MLDISLIRAQKQICVITDVLVQADTIMSGTLQNKQSPVERPREASAAVETDAECQLSGGLCIRHCQAREALEFCKLFYCRSAES